MTEETLPTRDPARYATTDGQPPAPGHDSYASPAPKPIDPQTGQHGSYWVLSEAERRKGFVRPLRRSYQHRKCGGVTTMGMAIAETYACQPTFYGSTFCTRCGEHFPVIQFVWLDPSGNNTGEAVGS